MRSKVLIISTVIFAISVSSCSDRSTEESINNVTSAIGSRSTNFNKNGKKVEGNSKDTTKSHEPKFNTKAEQEQELVDPDKIVRPR
ncbi:hypothetical protein [Elizabethkingia anophelis]|uniref:hypothetical protein n=1 Tax=Elizabethkingia anophelis TaxID=1117645 RepID=UPI00200C1A07|nr:hypothetical protein [Elizabethkingia anophelis]MCL1034640.1 hypothetical protein [Elizabethkingia anophelis]WMC07801.1 MAG: hypothetical protein PQ275_24200 [Elizabethkingia anophelis]HAY3555731.1 hypothetical protein [Elizabethkingia meningoseptica]